MSLSTRDLGARLLDDESKNEDAVAAVDQADLQLVLSVPVNLESPIAVLPRTPERSPKKFSIPNEQYYQDRIEELAGSITPATARAILLEVRNMPAAIDTYDIRLQCLQANPKLETWHAFTTGPLDELEQLATGPLKLKLTNFKLWIPQVQRIMLNTQLNMLTQLTNAMSAPDEKQSEVEAYQGAFFAQMKNKKGDRSPRNKKTLLVIARGMPTAGKTSALTDTFALSADQVKEAILRHFNGLNPQQTHFQSAAIIDSFRNTAEKFFEQAISRDSLYPDKVSVEADLKSARAKNQRVRIMDLSVPFKTLCCRMLKRSLYSPRISFDLLKENFIKIRENANSVIQLVQQNQDIIDHYRLMAWNEGDKKFSVVACLEDGNWRVEDQEAFSKLTTPLSPDDMEALKKELEMIGDTVITKEVIDEITENLPNESAREFEEALRKYEGQTFRDALLAHSLEPIRAPSPTARIVQEAHTRRRQDL